MLIAIDGPAGAGKSTVARGTAAALGFTYLDSGAMYRCVALAQLERQASGAPGVEVEDAAELADAVRIELEAPDSGGEPRVRLDGRDVSQAIRTPQVADIASRVAADPGVRRALVAKQREVVADGDWVAEGRDIGTVVAPDAAVKVFLTASVAERARRRAAEQSADPERVRRELQDRDERDRSRQHSPLKAAVDAIELDTTGLTVGEVVQRIIALARPALAERGAGR
ncbi:MAG TPA: (d)CMP kinase [Solirubrobacteraceae bacterium]|jgi:cytidylate kinase|nr:(d)CMP kinase [Solirubrobacteraceae bacterium]